MTRAALLIACAFLSACADTRTFTVQRQPPPQGQPVALEFMQNLPIITVDADGTPLQLIVDLGGDDALALDHKVIGKVVRLTSSQRKQISYDAAGTMSINHEIVVPMMTLGDLVAIDVHGRSVTLPKGLDPRIEGTLGAAFLEKFLLLIDYPQEIVLYPRGVTPPGIDLSEWGEVAISKRRTTQGTLDGRGVKIGWDTGANRNVIDNDLAEELTGAPIGEVTGAITIGGHDLGAVTFRAIELRGAHVDMLLGFDFFTRHRVLVDVPAKKAWIERARPTN